MTRVRVRITATDIAQGERESCDSCPIAFAIARRFGVRRAFADYTDSGLVWSTDKRYLRRQEHRACRVFMERFDRGKRVKPFSFFLHLNEHEWEVKS
jgi:hypothetical protein